MTADNRQKKSVWSPDFHYEMDDRPWEHENADWCSQAVSQLAESTGIAYEDCRRRFCIWVEGWLPQEVEELEGKNWTEYAQPWEPEPLPRLPHDVRVALREANRKYWVERLREWDDEAKAAGFGGIASREERIEAYMAYKRTEEAKAGR